MEFVGYVVKINNCYYRAQINGDYMICKSFDEAMKITSIRYARKIAGEIRGTVRPVYVSDEKINECEEQ